MSDLQFSSPELYQFSTDVEAIGVPGFADDSGADLRGGVRGSEVAASNYDKAANAAEFRLDRARRGLLAFGQLARDIAQHFDSQDHINAEELQGIWDKEHGTLHSNRNADLPPALPTTGETR
jgi:hypothetical protein